MPERHQRKRTLGWRKPEGAVIVDRTSKWGNPYRWSDYPASRSETSIDGECYTVQFSAAQRRRWAVTDYEHQYLAHHPDAPTREQIARELAGKDLVCWCPLVDADGNPAPCHADVLLSIANHGAPDA